MARALTLQNTNDKTLVEFVHNSTNHFFTDYPGGVVGGYMPLMGLEVVLPANVLGLAQQDCMIVLPLKDQYGFTPILVDLLQSAEPLGPVMVTIKQKIVQAIAVGGNTDDTLVLFEGRVSKVVRNHAGRTDAIAVYVQSTRARLKTALGLVATDQCAFPFGDQKTCKVAIGPLQNNGTMTVVGIDATITGATVPGSSPQRDNYYRGGYVKKDDLRILIRDWVYTSPTIFRLTQVPPAAWAGATVQLTPGCDKSRISCRDRWNNEVNFGGFGYAMPAYDPNLDAPG